MIHATAVAGRFPGLFGSAAMGIASHRATGQLLGCSLGSDEPMTDYLAQLAPLSLAGLCVLNRTKSITGSEAGSADQKTANYSVDSDPRLVT